MKNFTNFAIPNNEVESVGGIQKAFNSFSIIPSPIDSTRTAACRVGIF